MPKAVRPDPLARLHQRLLRTDAAWIDALYGLEPLFEPSAGDAALGAYVEYPCPYCGEHIGMTVHIPDGSRSCIEDCQVCCQPMELLLVVDADGALGALTVRRLD